MFLAEMRRARLVHLTGNPNSLLPLLHNATKLQSFHLPGVMLLSLSPLASCEAGQSTLVPRSAQESSEY